MPVTSFALAVFAALAALGLVVWAVSAWGVTAVLAGLLALAVAARWAMAPVPHDDPRA